MRGAGTEPSLAFTYYVDLAEFPLRHVFATARTVLDFKRCTRAYFAEYATRSVHGDVHPLAVIDGAVVVEPGASVGPLAVIQGPAHVCAGARVRPQAYIREDVIIGPGCLVGHASEITRSAMLSGSRAAHFAFVSDSLIGNDVNLGSHAVFTTLRVDRPITEPATEEITVRIGNAGGRHGSSCIQAQRRASATSSTSGPCPPSASSS